MRSLLIALVSFALAGVAGCDKEKSPQSTPSPSTTAALAPAPSAASPVAVAPAIATASAGVAATVENIPVAADFEEEAEKSITKANYRSELDSLEAEIK
jgi:hypothetical protein